ncbi:hypothetical protein P5673_010395 [Acropora cervicornis]|uniref:Uncharacterized protein n=1 Tax=Acropora cervicornis TaxID=6130 RepID=A0AAD9QS04_ACRCE|nr:hypothetical protein P5673_010395 [Acropora cervicornis]
MNQRFNRYQDTHSWEDYSSAVAAVDLRNLLFAGNMNFP